MTNLSDVPSWPLGADGKLIVKTGASEQYSPANKPQISTIGQYSPAAAIKTEQTIINQPSTPAQRLWRYHALPSFFAAGIDELPAPLPPLPLMTVPSLIQFLAKKIEQLPRIEYDFAPFGENKVQQNSSYYAFLSAIVRLAAGGKGAKIELILRQLGRDFQKYSCTAQQVDEFIEVLASGFADLATREEFIGWLRSFRRPILAGMGEPISAKEARVFEIIDHEPSYKIIRILATHYFSFYSGQYCEVMSERIPGVWRYVSIASPANPIGQIDVHIRGNDHIFFPTDVGDIWYIGQIHGSLPRVVEQAAELILLGQDTALAPMRSIALGLHTQPEKQKPTRFIAIHPNEDWFEKELFTEIASHSDWLTIDTFVTPTEAPEIDSCLAWLSTLELNPQAHIIIAALEPLHTAITTILSQRGFLQGQIHQPDPGILGVTSMNDHWR